MVADSDKKHWLQRYSPIISMGSAIVAAALTAFVTYKVANLEIETKMTLGASMQNIEKARLFQELIEELTKDDTGPLALLVLWRVYWREQERKTIIVAAFEVKKTAIIESLIRLEKEEDWEPYLETIKRLAKSEDSTIAKNANLFVSSLGAEDVGQYQIDNISRDADVNVFSDSVKKLMELARDNATVRRMILETRGVSEDREAILAYILYKTGDKSPFRTLLKNKTGDPDSFKDFQKVFCCGDFDPVEMLQISRFATSYLRKNLGQNLGLDSLSFTLLADSFFQNVQLNDKDRPFIISISEDVFLDQNERVRVRERALVTLNNIDRMRALLAITNVMIRGDEGPAMKDGIDNVLNGTSNSLGGAGLRIFYGNYEIPDINADSKQWKELLVRIQTKNEA